MLIKPRFTSFVLSSNIDQGGWGGISAQKRELVCHSCDCKVQNQNFLNNFVQDCSLVLIILCRLLLYIVTAFAGCLTNITAVMFQIWNVRLLLKVIHQNFPSALSINVFQHNSSCAYHNEQDGKAFSRGPPYRAFHLFLHDQLQDSFPNRVGHHNAILVGCWVHSHPSPEPLLQLQYDRSRSLPK